MTKLGELSYWAYKDWTLDFETVKRFISDACPEGPILEIGAGFGRLLTVLTENRNATLVEWDPESLEIAKKHSKHFDNVTTVCADAFCLPFNDGTYSGILLEMNAIAEMQPIAFVLSEISRILNVGGKVHLLVQNSECNKSVMPKLKTFQFQNEPWSMLLDTFPMRHFGRYSYQTHLRFSNGKQEKAFVVPQTLPTIAIWKKLLEIFQLSIEHVEGDLRGGAFDPQKSFFTIITATKLEPKFNQTPDCQATSIQRVYDSMAPVYEQNLATGYKIPDWVATQLEPIKGSSPRVLDLACGTGWLPAFLGTNGVHPLMYGIDISPQMILQARNKGKYRGLITASLDEWIPILEENYFDLVTAFGLTEFLTKPEKTLEQIKAILSPGGRAFLTFEATRAGESNSVAEIIPQYGITKTRYSTNTIIEMMSQAELVIETLDTGPAYFSPSTNTTVHYHYLHVRKRGICL